MEAIFAVAILQAIAVLSAVWLSNRRTLLDRGMPSLLSLAVGVLLATALLHILPEAVAGLGNRRALWLVFAGTIFALFCIEQLFAALTGQVVEDSGQPVKRWAPGHHHNTRSFNLLFGGMLHSFVDGVSVAAAFSAGPRVGWLTTAAITLHEVPHRMGDYALLTHLKVTRTAALRLILLVALAAVAGALLVLLAGHALVATIWLLPVSAGSFIYIALVSLMPELVTGQRLGSVCWQLLCMLVGAGMVALLLQLPNA